MNTPALDKFLAKHFPHCSLKTTSWKPVECSCGQEKAQAELAALKAEIERLQNATSKTKMEFGLDWE